MQAIKTYYLPPTTYRGSRIKAVCEAGSVILPWTYEGGDEMQHERALCALVNKLGWTPDKGYTGEWKAGWFAGDAYWVLR